MKQGALYVVATPIGNLQDLTRRARRILQEADAVICEEHRAGSTLLAQLQITKPLYELNEHSRPTDAEALCERLRNGERLALISDHGTPLVQDPGAELVAAAIRAGVRVEPIPGASAILAALVASGIAAPRFRFVGLLPPKREARAQALKNLRAVRETMILLDAPYRLAPLLNALCDAFGSERRAAVACNLTTPQENFVRGALAEIVDHFTRHPFKGEFVVVIEGVR
ncbi:MAG: 16S rRNA (cytidine(1402)-2'-O)-methyltransferase [Chloroflexi bacterium]|nr:16S rRNA (cytidine(1402)-2'-O)-methyltransferase [Chloroflexota bacterium]